MRVLWWIVTPFVVVHVVLASISGCRAIVQVYRVDLRADAVLHAGSRIEWGYVSSGRVASDAELELVQGRLRVSLDTLLMDANLNRSYDPRSRHAARIVLIDARSLAAFAPGPVVLRATGYGNMQWLRTPPPVMRELYVRLEK
jgi:hypothetical protein